MLLASEDEEAAQHSTTQGHLPRGSLQMPWGQGTKAGWMPGTVERGSWGGRTEVGAGPVGAGPVGCVALTAPYFGGAALQQPAWHFADAWQVSAVLWHGQG